jgi:hypothetical protein
VIQGRARKGNQWVPRATAHVAQRALKINGERKKCSVTRRETTGHPFEKQIELMPDSRHEST